MSETTLSGMFYKRTEIMGRLGQDPAFTEGKKENHSDDRATGTLCYRNPFRKDDPPEWYRYVAWGSRARLMANYCKKGKIVMLVGEPRLSTVVEKFTDENGQVVEKPRTFHEVVVNQVVLGADAKSQQAPAEKVSAKDIMDAILGLDTAQLQAVLSAKLQAEAQGAEAPAEEPAAQEAAAVNDHNPF